MAAVKIHRKQLIYRKHNVSETITSWSAPVGYSLRTYY